MKPIFFKKKNKFRLMRPKEKSKKNEGNPC